MHNRYDRKMQYIGLVILILLVISMAFLLIKDLIITKDYIQVEATYNGITTEYGSGSLSQMMQYKSANYTFEYEGKIWEASRPTFFGSDKNAGEVKQIKCNPLEPTELENVAFRQAEIIILFLSILSIIAVKRSM